MEMGWRDIFPDVDDMTAHSIMMMQSGIYGGYHILRKFQKHGNESISICDAATALKSGGMEGSRQLTLALTFLYSLGIVDFDEGMIRVVSEAAPDSEDM